ncbi:hypothetical protein EVAR_16677_1 [Eumeta japonica]|uniref:Uncharacterized protein n=1 Tax=Eumeta variegata TaxID=151549 RepID=A0A4C1V4D5_EUMVA|nr:hypothetical protein EVAR_16677_1 [Eumeta japonica]
MFLFVFRASGANRGLKNSSVDLPAARAETGTFRFRSSEKYMGQLIVGFGHSRGVSTHLFVEGRPARAPRPPRARARNRDGRQIDGPIPCRSREARAPRVCFVLELSSKHSRLKQLNRQRNSPYPIHTYIYPRSTRNPFAAFPHTKKKNDQKANPLRMLAELTRKLRRRCGACGGVARRPRSVRRRLPPPRDLLTRVSIPSCID